MAQHLLALAAYVCMTLGGTVGLPTTATAQAPDAAAKTADAAAQAETAAAIAGEIEKAAAALLERHIPAEQFQVVVDVTLKGDAVPRIPYMQDGVPRLASGMGVDVLRPYVTQLKLRVFLTPNVKKKAINSVTLLLESKLKIGKRFGDDVAFDTIDIDVPRPQSDVERELLSTESKLRDLERDLKTAAKERDDAKLESVTSKAELDRIAREKAAAMTPAGETKAATLWERHGLAILVGGSLALSMLILGILVLFATRALGSRVKDGIKTMAAALEGGLQALGGQQDGNGDSTMTMKLDGAGAAGLLPNGGGGGQGMMPLASVQERLLQLHEELLNHVNDMTEAITLRHVDALLAVPATVAKGVVTLELLGRDKANALFNHLSQGAQDEVLKFLKDGAYQRPKGELMLEAGEDLKTKLLAEAFDQALFKPDRNILERLLKIGDDELAQVVASLDEALVPRFLRNLEPTRIAALMGRLRQLDRRRYKVIVETLPKIGAAQGMGDLDERIIQALDEKISQIREDSERPYLKFYRAIVEAADETLTDEILAGFASVPRVGRYLEGHVITIATLFKAPETLQTEIVERLSNKDVAALVGGLAAEQQQILRATIPERRRELVEEEIERMNSRGQAAAATMHAKAKAIVISRLRQLKDDGVLQIGGDVRRLTDGVSPDEQKPKAA